MDNFTSEIRVVDDSNQIWFTQVFTAKYRKIQEGNFVRIRGATLEHHEEYDNCFGLKPQSNILNLPYPCKMAKDVNVDSF
jgi:hypothetical protein